MSQASNILDNQNYMHKDFPAIYKELLAAIKKLSDKWMVDEDSNESDPIILLIKELAATGDKLNYNADKNILEQFPKTVLQEVDARRLFDCIYKMNWYRAATGNVRIDYIAEDGESVIIPPFTMLSNEDNSTIFTTLNLSPITINKDTIVADRTIKVLLGVVETYSASTDTLITINDLVDNRLYFDDYNVAQNGILVFDNGYLEDEVMREINTNQWKLVDNFYVEEVGTKCFEFNIDILTGTPYIEFPPYVEDIIGSGVVIKFIKTAGAEGNIGAKLINKVYKVTDNNYSSIDGTKVAIINTEAIKNGYNPDTIDLGYEGYMKNINVCKTLVTLRDYINTIYLADEPRLVSNVIVSDRTNDIQASYKVGDTIVQEQVDGLDTMSAFDLKFYGLHPVDNIENAIDYAKTFWLIDAGESGLPDEVANYIEDIKHIQHDFVSIKNNNKICFIKNYFNLKTNLIFKYPLQESQITEVKDIVKLAIYKAYNAREIDFSQRISYQEMIDTIVNSDSRIAACTVSGLDDDDFDAHAVFYSRLSPILYEMDNLTDETKILSLEGTVAAPQYEITESGTGTEIKLESVDFYVKKANEYEKDTDKISDVDEANKDFSNTTDHYVMIPNKDEDGNDVKSWKVLYGEERADENFLKNSLMYACAANPDKDFDKNIVVKLDVKLYIPVKIDYDPTGHADAVDGVMYIYNSGSSNYYYVAGNLGGYINVANDNIFNLAGYSTKVLTEPVEIKKFIAMGSFYHSLDTLTYYYLGAEASGANCFYKFSYLEKATEEETKGKIGYYYKDVDYNYYEDIEVGSFPEVKISIEDLDELDLSNCSNDISLQFLREILSKAILNYNTPLLEKVKNFDLSILDLDARTILQTKYISPAVDINLSKDKRYYTLREHENILIIQPAFNDIAEYSLYVYCSYYKRNNVSGTIRIPANSTYVLSEDEYLFFYYRSDDNANYNYARYSKGDIVSPSFTLTVSTFPDGGWQQGLIDGPATGLTSALITTYISNNTTLYNNNLTVIDGSNTVTIKEPLVVDLDKVELSYTLSFKLNGLNNQQVLFKEYDNQSSDDHVQYRALDIGEAVLLGYNDVILEEGVVLTRTVKAGEKAPAITGPILFGNKLETGIKYYVCNISQIGKDSLVKIEPTLFIENKLEAYASPSGGKHEYLLAEATESSPHIFSNINNVEASYSNVTEGDGKTIFDWFLSEIERVGYDINYNYHAWVKGNTGSTRHLMVVIKSTTDVGLDLTNQYEPLPANVNFYYKESSASEYTQVSTSKDFTGGFVLLRSVLDIDMGPSKALQLSNDTVAFQSITLYNDKGIALATARGNSKELLMANKELLFTGGEYLALEDGTNIYIKKNRPQSSNPSIAYTSYGSATLKLSEPAGENKGKQTLPINTQTWANYYIIAMTVKESAIEENISVTVEAEGTSVTDIYGNEEFKEAKTYYLVLNGTIGTNIELTFLGAKNGTILVANLIAPYNSLYPYEEVEKVVKSYMSKLDYNSLFDFTQDIEDKMYIKNPLSSASFFNIYHPYNKATICELKKEPEVV